MIQSDFENIKISLLNVEQNKYCDTIENNDTIKENDLCWTIPRREPANLTEYENSEYIFFEDIEDADTYWNVDGQRYKIII